MDFVSEKTYDEMLAGLTRNAKVVQIHQIECQNWPEQFTKLNRQENFVKNIKKK